MMITNVYIYLKGDKNMNRSSNRNMKILIAGFFVASMVLSSFLSVGAVNINQEKTEDPEPMSGGSVTIIVKDKNSDPYPDVYIQLKDNDVPLRFPKGRGRTGNDGTVTFYNLPSPQSSTGKFDVYWKVDQYNHGYERDFVAPGETETLELSFKYQKSKNLNLQRLPIISNIFRLLNLNFFNL